tara:strand:- start:71 stop:907 length:837 start_codon:yes stop_codon:yes gene_type:complete
MKYSFNTWVYGSFPVWLPSYPLEEVIKRLAKIGYDGIEIGCAAPHAWPNFLNQKRRNFLKQTFDNNNIKASSLLPAPGGGPGNNPASIYEEERIFTVNHYKDVINLASDLGAKTVMYICGWQIFGASRTQCYELSLKSLQEIAKYAKEKGINIAVEPTSADSNLIDTADQAIELMKDTGYDNVKLMFDTFHAQYRNEVSSDYVYKMASNLIHVHIADTDRLAPGKGKVDFFSVMKALKDINYDGYITMEVGFTSRASEPDKIARDSLLYLKQLENNLK